MKSPISNSAANSAFTPKQFALAIVLFILCVLFATAVRAQDGSARTSVRSSSGAANSTTSNNTTASTLQTGTTAPDFTLPYATQERVFVRPDEQMRLSSLRGRNVILAFYPADWSGGCTREVCTLRDTFTELSRLNATVLGVSGDYVFSHHEWAKHHGLQFPLLSDHDHRVARLYNSFDEGSGYNKRSVVLIDRNDIVRYVNLNFRAGEASDYNTLRTELERLQQSAPTGGSSN